MNGLLWSVLVLLLGMLFTEIYPYDQDRLYYSKVRIARDFRFKSIVADETKGTGGVSITGLILAKAAGAKTIVTSSSDEKLKFVQDKFGADHVINYKKHPEWSKEALRLTTGEGVDYILENGGSGTIGESLNAIKMGGNVSVIGFLSQAEQSKMPDVASLALSKGAVVRGIVVGSTQLLQEVTRFVAAKELRLPIDKVFDFTEESVIKAFEYASSGSHIGKVCIKVAE